MPNDSRRRLHRSTDVEIPTSGAGFSSSQCSLAVKLLGLLVEWSALLDNCETLDLEFLTGLLNCCNPGRLLAKGALLLDGLHRLHCSHGFHCLHCLGHCPC